MPNIEAEFMPASVSLEKKRIHVAVGVIKNDQQKILIARRADHLHQGGLWEFPGGKVESGETVLQALNRELFEELNITVEQAKPFMRISHDYPDKSVLLDVWLVEKFTGIVQPNQGQPLLWTGLDQLHDYSFPIANRPIITALRLSREMMITGTWVDEADFEKRLFCALRHGVRLVQLRAHQLDKQTYQLLFERAKNLCDQYSALLIANTNLDCFNRLPAWALHLTSIELMKYQGRPVSKNILLGASCHSWEQIQQAEKIGADYVVLGPVYETSTHPEVTPLGIKKFSKLIESTHLPVFALGGVGPDMLKQIIECGGFGVAGISHYWPSD